MDSELLLERYAVADSLAMHFQTATDRARRSLLTLTALAAFAYNFHDSTCQWSLPFYLVALILAWMVWDQSGRFKMRHLDTRALAGRNAGTDGMAPGRYRRRRCRLLPV